MKRLAVLLLAGALVTLILQPVSPTVNTLPSNSGLRADGGLPPPFPPPRSGTMLVADGSIPPPFPPTWSGTTLVADGAYPPPFPPTSSGTMAHGAPSEGLLT